MINEKCAFSVDKRSPLKKSKILLAIKFGENFQEIRNYQSQKFDNDRQFLAMTNPFYLHKQPDLS